jgi:hypothetical protein
VRDLCPIVLEGTVFVKIGAVIQIMAFQTTVLRLLKRQSHRDPQQVSLGFLNPGVLPLGLGMLLAGSVAVFTPIPLQMAAILQRKVSRFIGVVILRVPTGNVATDALGVKVPRNITPLPWLDDVIGSSKVRRPLPNGIGGRMALSTNLRADKAIPGRMCDRSQTETGKA